MTVALLQEMIIPLIAALLVLSVAELMLRRWIRGPSNDMRQAVQQAMQGTLKAHAARGTPLARISREARVPHDVVSLAMYVENNRVRARRADTAASNAAQGR